MEAKKTSCIAKAILKFQEKNRAQKTNAENPYFQSDYVTLDKVWEKIRPDLQALGLAVIQNPMFENGLYGVESIIMHIESGEETRAKLLMPLAKNDPQGVGSAITYARRYCLTSQLGLTVDTDDDANAAIKQPDKTTQSVHKPDLQSAFTIQKIKEINEMLCDRFGDNNEEIKAYILKLTTWVDKKDNTTHKGIETADRIKSDKQATFLYEKIKKEWQSWQNSINAGQKMDKEKVDNETIPF